MTDRAADIEDLEKMLNGGGSDEDLCSRSIEIFERLAEEANRYRYSGSGTQRNRIEDEVRDFADVIKQIERRRHEHALDRFKEYLTGQPD
ncbi:MAG: hypothetical protein Q7S52_04905 [bacterium]|nr:hypothetical protein [bacterium]